MFRLPIVTKRKQYSVHGCIFVAAMMMSLSACGDDSTHVIDEYEDIPKFLAHQKIPGVSIATIKDNAVDKLLVYGVTQQDSDVPVSKDTLFQAGAISQSVTALAAVMLFHQHDVSIDSDINDTLSSWELDSGQYASANKASLRKLLSHTAGTNVVGYSGYKQGERLPTLKQILSNTGNSNSPGVIINEKPGAYNYSVGGYTVVQQALEDLEGRPFARAVSETLFRPIGMHNTAFEQPLSSKRLPMAAAGHNKQGEVVPGKHQNYPELAAAGLWSTAEDLAKLVCAIQIAVKGESDTVSRESVADVLAPVVSNYALGFDLEHKDDAVFFGRGGISTGFQSLIFAHQTKGVGVVIMTNSDNGFEAITRLVDFIAEEEDWPDY